MLHKSITVPLAAVSAAMLLAACSKSDTGSADSSAASVADMPAQTDTGMGTMAGMDHSTMNATPAKDPDQEFVRMMVDHHQGLVEIADATLAKNPSDHVRKDATAMKQKQAAEQKMMISILKSDYGEDKMAMAMPANASAVSAVASKTGADLDRTFREKVIAHHEEALKMVDDYTPKFTKPAVRTMAAKMKSDQQKEIAKLKSELKAM